MRNKLNVRGNSRSERWTGLLHEVIPTARVPSFKAYLFLFLFFPSTLLLFYSLYLFPGLCLRGGELKYLIKKTKKRLSCLMSSTCHSRKDMRACIVEISIAII